MQINGSFPRSTHLAKEVTENLDKYELGIAVQKVYDFIWEEFCDWYIEMVKPRLYNDEDTTKAAALWTLKTVLIQCPEASASLYAVHHRGDLLHPSSGGRVHYDCILAGVSGGSGTLQQDETAIETIKEAVRAIRNVRTGMNVPPSKKAKVYRCIRG